MLFYYTKLSSSRGKSRVDRKKERVKGGEGSHTGVHLSQITLGFWIGLCLVGKTGFGHRILPHSPKYPELQTFSNRLFLTAY